jgi:hypothetical protein
VALAPNAVTAPKVPTMKYWKVLFVVSFASLLYFAKLGIFVVSEPPTPLKGLSNELVCETSVTLRRCCTCIEAAELRTALGRPWRAQDRAIAEVEALRADMTPERRGRGRVAGN